MSKRGVLVNDPNSTVLVDNVSTGIINLPRELYHDIIFSPGETAQITWAEYIRFKNIPHFGKMIELNDSVIISDGFVKIKDAIGELSQEEMVSVLTQKLSVVKEFIISLNAGERKVFSIFMESRFKLGIEKEKCELMFAFIDKEFPEQEQTEKKVEPVAAKEAKPKKKKKGKKAKGKKLIENEDHLSIQVVDADGDSE